MEDRNFCKHLPMSVVLTPWFTTIHKQTKTMTYIEVQKIHCDSLPFIPLSECLPSINISQAGKNKMYITEEFSLTMSNSEGTNLFLFSFLMQWHIKGFFFFSKLKRGLVDEERSVLREWEDSRRYWHRVLDAPILDLNHCLRQIHITGLKRQVESKQWREWV